MSSSSNGGIGKRELDHLAKLARIELDPAEEEKLLKDLGNILEHFKELQALDTANIPSMAGGTDLMNVFREDGVNETTGEGHENTDRGAGVDAFPESKDGYNKVPPVFE